MPGDKRLKTVGELQGDPEPMRDRDSCERMGASGVDQARCGFETIDAVSREDQDYGIRTRPGLTRPAGYGPYSTRR